MRTKQLVIDLLEYIELYEKSNPFQSDLNIKSFIAFMNGILVEEKPSYDQSDQNNVRQHANIARDISLLHRYSKSYIKTALSKSDFLQTEDDYSYLVNLFSDNGLTKTELNNRNAMEKTSGAEIIRRLNKNGLIYEEPDTEDRRSVRVFITDKGREELYKMFPSLRISAGILCAPLCDEQKNTLSYLLTQLCQAHRSMFGKRGDMTLEQIYAAMKNKE